MKKTIHTMIRVFDLDKSLAFYRDLFDFKVAHRADFADFSLIYLKNSQSDFELELTHNHDRQTPYDIGDGYGHLAFSVENLEATHADYQRLGYKPLPIKSFTEGEQLLAKFFFISDPDGYKIEVLQRLGHYQ